MPRHIQRHCPIIASTPEEAAHFFGFHDLCPWNRANDTLAILRAPGDLMRVPVAGDTAEVCLWSPASGEVTPIGQTHAWNWQQGARLQWHPTEPNKLIYNDFVERAFRAVVYDIVADRSERLPFSVYDITPDGRYAVSPHFARLHAYWTAYGYAGATSPGQSELTPDNDGLYICDLKTQRVELVVSVAQAAACGGRGRYDHRPNFLTHPKFNPSGTRFCFMYRFHTPDGALYSRLLVADRDGRNLQILAEEKCSHFDWYDDETLIVWARYLPLGLSAARRRGWTAMPVLRTLLTFGRRLRPELKQRLLNEAYFWVSTRSLQVRKLGAGLLEQDGHPMFSKDRRWMLTDTYPDPNKGGHQVLILYDLKTDTRIDIQSLFSPPAFASDGGIKCDLHPRWNHANTQVCVDSAHTGTRQVHVIDISGLFLDAQGG